MLLHGTNVEGVRVTKLIRLGGRGQNQINKPRLIMATLDQPARRRVILAAAKTLRHTDNWSNVYISPDLYPSEREKERKLREELKTRRDAGETDIIIRGSQIITRTKRPVPHNTTATDSDSTSESNDTTIQVSDSISESINAENTEQETSQLITGQQ